MSNNYIVSAQKPTVITHALTGNFFDKKQLQLVLARINRLEVLSITAEGLKSFSEIPVFGRIALIKVFRAKNDEFDSLLILTVKYHLAIICWDGNGKVSTRASGSVADRIGRPSETGVIAMIHASGLLAFRLYDGVIKLIQWSDGKDLRGFNVRCDDLHIIDINFLDDPSAEKPTLVYICRDRNGCHLKTTMVNLSEKELHAPTIVAENIEHESSILIAVPQPLGGVIVIGRETVTYCKNKDVFVARAPLINYQSHATCYGIIDSNGQRYLVGDLCGRLFLVKLEVAINFSGVKYVCDIKFEFLGECSIPECIVYLDNGVAFVGSRFGDSQLIRLSCQAFEDGSFIQVLDRFSNLAPIRDLTVLNVNGQQQIITCSGCFKDGSLRLIRNGIGIAELASIALPDIRALYTMRLNSEFDDYLVIGFDNTTHMLKFVGENLEDVDIPGLSISERTIWAGNLESGGILQITISGMYIVKNDTNFQWVAPSRISVASVNPCSGQVVIACRNLLHYLQITDHVELIKVVECDYEVSCIDISPIGKKNESEVIALAYWTEMSVALMTISDMKEVTRQKVGDDMLARSILLCTMEDIVYLLVGLGDGTLHYFQIDMSSGILIEPKKATLGTRPLILRKFISNGIPNVFACSDRPAVVFSSNHKLVFSNVNVRLVTHMTPLNAESYVDCTAFTDGEYLILGKVDDIQKLHIRAIPLGESPARIASQPETGTLAILTHRNEYMDKTGVRCGGNCASKSAANISSSQHSASRPDSKQATEWEVSSVLLMDANTFEILHCHEVGKNEVVMSLRSCELGGQEKRSYYAVGTALIYDDETEAKLGRILIFEVSSINEGRHMRLVHEKEVKGAVYNIQSLDGKLVAAVNSCVRLFEWTADKELRLECSDFDNVVALYLSTKNNYVLVGDLMRSLSLLYYKPMEGTFEKVARDFVTNWMTACEIVEKNAFLGAENSYNLFTVKHDNSATTVEEQMRLTEVGLYHLGELVNVFRHGSIVASHIDTMPPYTTPILYGTNDGGLGLIVQLSDSFFKFLSDLQKQLVGAVENCLRISHTQYRLFETEKRAEPPIGFIDGDLIETILDLSREKIQEIIQDLKLWTDNQGEEPKTASVDDILKIVEDLSRIH